jgi:hypothetical protein
MRVYKLVSIMLMFLFAATGLLLLLIPDQVLALFNHFSSSLGLPKSPSSGLNFNLILAVAYMYLVTLLAFFMFLHPQNKYFPQLLAHAKIASSLLSLLFFLVHDHYLIYLANCLIDGIIGAGVIWLSLKMRRSAQWASY